MIYKKFKLMMTKTSLAMMSDAVFGTFDPLNAKKITPHIRNDVGIKLEQILLRENPKLIYPYSDMLDRCVKQINEHNPLNNGSNNDKFLHLPSIKMKKVGKRTIFHNFSEICSIIKRDREHLKLYICSEQNTNASIDATGQLCIGYRIDQSNLEKIIAKYIKNYVKCRACGSYETHLIKESRVSFIICSRCSAQSQVKPIKMGFKADVSKRKFRDKNALI
ncbi:Domain found in IF2B/IF5 family protein [Tritrichomonas foetus]|uniref:Domain found in IF2B/IF5 family protein n=1 Tax=Tritrichomonas foetus TaxID=1144522 RepID=A0A1J4J7H9_9EUKA|nr:Domain found in IF2B/IF5 family protein [Tritrichomonas foetus]|eukprot:OHS93619.1 Domain found in IF2B/IF5 family protein [Tritrichomonas foetus]